MEVKSLSLIEETESHYIFEVEYSYCFNLFCRKRKAQKEKTDKYPRWLDTNRLIVDYEGIQAWLSTDKKDFNT